MEAAGLVQRLEALLPAIRARREEIERERHLPRELVAALRDTGVFALEIPRAIGGMQAAPVEILQAIDIVSRADGSTGWCTALTVANNGVAGFMNGGGRAIGRPRGQCARRRQRHLQDLGDAAPCTRCRRGRPSLHRGAPRLGGRRPRVHGPNAARPDVLTGRHQGVRKEAVRGSRRVASLLWGPALPTFTASP
jgi:Acyl-CoA dehydrogenase, N-terminal domain